jgi:hypothetical protein
MIHRTFSLILVTLLALPFASCKDEKTRTCEATWKRINQCLPQFAQNKEMHLKVCKETFEKSSTRGSNRCAASFTNCEQFKKCLSYGARCRDYEAKEFDNCLTAAPLCAEFNPAEFKHCIVCVQSGQEKTLEKCVQGRIRASRSDAEEIEEPETPPAADMPATPPAADMPATPPAADTPADMPATPPPAEMK